MWSAEQGKSTFPCPRSRLRIRSRETGSAVLSCVSLLISIFRLNLVLTRGIPPEFRGGVRLFILNRHTPLGQSQVYRVTQMRTDGVHCRESAGTGPVNLKEVPNECCLGRSPRTNLYTPLFATPSIGMKLLLLNAPRPSEHPPVRGENMSKRLGLGGIKGCKYKTSSWHLNGFPDGNNIESTVCMYVCMYGHHI